LFASFQNIPQEQMLIMVILAGMMLFFFGASFAGLLYAFTRTTRGMSEKFRTNAPEALMEATPGSNRLGWLIGLVPGIALIAVMYTVQVLRFRGIDTEFVRMVLSILGV
jgi:hypothetical protein